MSRYKGRSARVAKLVAFHTFGEIRPLMNRFVLSVYDDPDDPPFEIVCDTREAAVMAKERLIEADMRELDAYVAAALPEF